MRQIAGIVILAALLAFGGGSAALAQSSYQPVSNPAGYQFQVPTDWVPGTATESTETYMGSPTIAADAYVVVRMPDGATPAERLQTLTKNALTPIESQSSYVVTNPSSPVQVAGADASDGGAATFVDQSGTAAQEYIIAAIKGTTGYVLIVDIPLSVDVATPALAQTILGSFKLTPSGAAAMTGAISPVPPTRGAETAAPAATTATTPAPAPSAAAPTAAAAQPVTPIYTSNFSAGAANWAPLKGTESIGVDATHEVMAGSPALRVTTPGAAVPEGVLVNSGAVDAGAVYTVTLWVNASAGATLQLALGVNDVGIYAQNSFTGTGGWQQITLAGTSQAAGVNQVQVRTSDSSQATTFWVGSVDVDPGLSGSSPRADS